MIVKLFQPRFAPLVESGTKRQTIRPTPKRMPKIGDALSLRQWTGLPYRSPQRVLREASVKAVSACEIHGYGLIVRGRTFFVDSDRVELDAFSKEDGFKDWQDLLEWFESTHDLPFSGILLEW